MHLRLNLEWADTTFHVSVDLINDQGTRVCVCVCVCVSE